MAALDVEWTAFDPFFVFGMLIAMRVRPEDGFDKLPTQAILAGFVSAFLIAPWLFHRFVAALRLWLGQRLMMGARTMGARPRAVLPI